MSGLDRLRALTVVLTNRCNLGCAYCFEDARGRRRQMSSDTLAAALALLARSAEPELTLLFYGGEPLLALPLLVEALERAERLARLRRRLRPRLVTNGLLLDDATSRLLERHRVFTRLSFDGVEPAQDQRGRGTFAVLDRLLRRLGAEQPDFLRHRVGVAVTLTARTIPWLADSVAYFLERGVTDIGLSPRLGHDPGWSDACLGELDRQLGLVRRLALRHLRRTGVVPVTLFRREAGDARPAAVPSAWCGIAAGTSLTVDVDGQVHGCPMLAGSLGIATGPLLAPHADALRLGDLRSRELASRLRAFPGAVRAARIFDHRQDKGSSYGRCRDCRHAAACAICPIGIAAIPGNRDPHRIPDFACAFERLALAHRERFPRPDRTALDLLRRGPDPQSLERLLAAAGPNRRQRR